MLPIAEARKNDEVISLASSQVLRWIDELNGVVDADQQAREIKRQIRMLRNEPGSVQNRRAIKNLYAQLDKIQFKPDYLCLIIDREKDYHRACRGFTVNSVRYKRLLGTNGGVKSSTIVFISERLSDEINRRIENGRDASKPLVPAKLEAYKALTCSASTPVSAPRGVLVVPECETKFIEDIIYMDDEGRGEPLMEYRPRQTINLDESDGYGLMLPSLARRWSEELGLDYVVGGVNSRWSWEKGMVFTFDFLDFAEKIAGKYIVKDAWGHEVDIRNVELILTTSMLKLYDCYESCEHYIRCCEENGYHIGITKTCPRELENERALNYQFIQSYDLDDAAIEELVRPTIEEITDVLHGDINKTILFLKGAGLSEKNIGSQPDDFAKALMVDKRMINDPYVQSSIYNRIRNRINEAKVGVLNVHGNYSMISGDPYALCQSIFGLPVTGLLAAGEIYNGYWRRQPAQKLVCFRAPMTCHNNIRIVVPNKTEAADYWYRYMQTNTVMNCWDSACHALNGADKDGDLVMLSDNRVLVDYHKPLPTLMCIQRRAEKKIITEEDIVAANIASFGDDIGKTTNWITSMFEVRARFDKDSEEYKALTYRINCGQLYQQNSIDKAKGIVAQPMPRSWHSRHAVNAIEDDDTRRFYNRIVADKKPYFMIYIYPDLMKQYNTYIKTTNKNALRKFQITMTQLLSLPEESLTGQQKEFVYYYKNRLPVGDSDCVMNRICRRFEKEFDGYLKTKKAVTQAFDCSIMKSGSVYTRSQYEQIGKLYEAYQKRLQNYARFFKHERVDEFEALAHVLEIKEEFERECAKACSDRFALCDILVTICYQHATTKSFAWKMCGQEIVANLLRANDGSITFPERDEFGDIAYAGKHFALRSVKIGVNV